MIQNRGSDRQTLLHLSPLAVRGGCEVNCLRIIEALPEYSHRVVVFGPLGPMTEAWRAAGAEVEHLEAWDGNAIAFTRKLATWAKAQTVVPAGIFYWSTSRLPFVFHALRRWHCPWVVHLGNPVGQTPAMRFRLGLYELAFRARQNVRLVACSRYVADTHRATAFYRRFALNVIPNPVSSVFDRSRTHRELPLGSDPVVGMVARLDSIKDHATVLRAMAMLVAQRPDVTVEFAGDGGLRPALEEEKRRLGLTKHVRFLGDVKDVASLLQRWDIYVHSTTLAEGMGTAVAEAMMAGLPCIVSDLPMMHEVCGDTVRYFRAGVASELADGLTNLIDDEVARRELPKRAQQRAQERFGAPAVAQQYLAALGQRAET